MHNFLNAQLPIGIFHKNYLARLSFFLVCCCQNCFKISFNNSYMLYIPIGLTVEEGARGVDVDHLTINECPIPFLGVLFGGVTEKPTTDGLLDSGSVFTTADYIQLVSTEKRKKIYSHNMKRS